MRALDRVWLGEHPLPPLSGGDKNDRGRALVVGGAEFVPGALRLTGEAALRCGAGKLQLATVRAAAMPLAVLMPEASMIALPADDDGEIAPAAVEILADRLDQCDALVIGPGMSAGERTGDLVAAVLGRMETGQTVVLDAAALTCCYGQEQRVSGCRARIVMTPHHGEMSRLANIAPEQIARDPQAVAQGVASAFGAVVALKGERTVIATPGGESVLFDGGSIGLATGGSGDVLAGIIGGLAARGADPFAAAGWGVFVHGAAGARAAREIAPVGFLARDLLPAIPGLLSELGDAR